MQIPVDNEMTTMAEFKKKDDNLLSNEYPSIQKYSSCIVQANKNVTNSVLLSTLKEI